MTLLTPPSTVHRVLADRENIPANVENIPGGSRVVWSQKNSYHSLATPASSSSSAASTKNPPIKSILKAHVQTSVFLLPFPAEPEPREVTPEPADPLADLNYLVYPVSQIIKHASDVSMRELIEAYNVLAARLRASIVGKTDLDASWPLFQPIRKHRKAFVDAVVRDLGRVLLDPASGDELEITPRALLPSPKSTPKKKKGGLTAEQVKYARDLSTISQSVIRLLSLVFTLPAIRTIFTDTELHLVLTALLAILLADDLPTPNARKTCALAIWLLQSQRLPATVLFPARDRIAFALRRGIDGELGKEGKKGSASDGLKAVHDLSTSHPAIFVPTFATTVLPSVLSSLLAPTLGLRTQACHALGGFVIGLTSLPRSKLHTRVSHTVAAFLTTPPPPKSPPISPNKSNTVSSPSKPSVPSSSSSTPTKSTSSPIPIINTLRTTLQANDPVNVAAGPVWGLSVLASLVVMLSSALTDDANIKLARVVSALVALAVKHKRSSVRAVGCLMWRCVIWVYFQDKLPSLDDGEGGSEAEEDTKKTPTKVTGKGKEAWWKVVTTVVELNSGACSIATLLGPSNEDRDTMNEDVDVDGDDPLQRTLQVLQYMVGKPQTRIVADALEVLKRLLGVPFVDSEQAEQEDRDYPKSLDSTKLLPYSLFSSLPGLLSVEFKDLATAVRSVFVETVGVEDVRPLTRGEVARGSAEPDSCLELDGDVGVDRDYEGKGKTDERGGWWMWEGLVHVWRGCVLSLWEGDRAGVTVGRGADSRIEKEKEAVRKDLVAVWESLVATGVGFLQDAGDDEATATFAVRVVKVLTNVMQDAPLDLLPPRSLPPTPESKSKQSSSPVSITAAKLTIDDSSVSSINTTLTNRTKLALIQRLWYITSSLIPHPLLASSGAPERLLASLMKREEDLTSSSPLSLRSIEEEEQETTELREIWTTLCVEVLVKCNPEALKAFWGYVNSDGNREWDWRWDARERAEVWRCFVDRWMGACENIEGGVGWEAAVVLLGVPFLDENAWEMGEADLKKWNEILGYATAQALDEGHDEADAHTVLSALATSIASHNTSLSFGTSIIIPTNDNTSTARAPSSPSTRLADLLLTTLTSSLSSGSCSQLPDALLDFVNDALRESYPPRPRDTTVFLWTARAVAGTVEACPRELIRYLLGDEGWIAEGVGVWIADQCKAWSDDQLGYDIVPLYQHILTRIQELPLALSTLRTYTSIIASPFVGREDMSVAAKDAFREFWEATYAGMKKPRKGWPEEVKVCLRAVYGEDEVNQETVIDPALLPPEATLASTSSATTDNAAATTVPDTPPVTPTKTTSTSTSAAYMSTSKKCTPRRPHKVNFYTQFPQRSPESPVPSLVPAAFSPVASSFPGVTPLPAFYVPSSLEVPSPSAVARAQTPSPGPSIPRKARMSSVSMRPSVFKSMHVAAPATPKRSVVYTPPAKRRKIGDRVEDKENEAPSARLLIRPSSMAATDDEETDWVVKPFTLGKRARMSEIGDCDGMTPQKKGRVTRHESGDSEDEKMVERLVIPDSDDLSAAAPTLAKKHKRIFMDAVEIPRLKDVYPNLKSSASSVLLRELCTPSYLSSPSQQLHSATHAVKTYAGGSSRKRSRASTKDVFSVSATSPVLLDSEPEIPFSDSFSLDNPPPSPKEELPSSDDDPRIGQVTPHRLISPIPRRSLRAKIYEIDPPSDDSLTGECASPSKEVVERKLKRFGSLTNVITTPYSIVARMNTKRPSI